jgi:hypothetical protein
MLSVGELFQIGGLEDWEAAWDLLGLVVKKSIKSTLDENLSYFQLGHHG